jgi:hypothetical protein
MPLCYEPWTMFRMKAFIILTASLFAVSAHAASYKCKDAHGNWSEAACTGVAAPPPKPEPPKEWAPRVGMTVQEVQYALDHRDQFPSFWTMLGHVDHINRTETARGVSEQWVFPGPNGQAYLYFDNGILTSIQK